MSFQDLPDRVRTNAGRRPDAIALVDGDRTLSWRELSDSMDRIAAYLIGRGIGRGAIVASLAGVSPEHVALYLGVLAAGAAMAPLPTSATSASIAAMLDNCDAALVVADGRGDTDPDARPRMALDALISAASDLSPADPLPLRQDDVFDVIYSSGTTGAPKGILHDHLFRNRQIARVGGYGFDDRAVTLVSTPIYSNTTLAALLPALAGGGRIVLMRKFDAGAFLALAQAHRVTHAMCVPVQYRRILAHPDFDATDLSAFRAKLSTSAPLPPGLVREILERWPGKMVNIYGMTEGGVGCLLDCGAYPDKLHTVGHPVRGAELRIIDERGRELPQGEAGEIVGRSSTMMSGYLGDPAKTSEAIWIAPDGTQFIRSGDMGLLDPDGFLCLMDRGKDMINSGGFNIFPADLEAVLTSHPDVAEAAVIAVPSEAWGETPLGVVVPRVPLDPEELRLWANARLGKTQRLSGIELRDALPRSDIGKVLKRELRESRWPGHDGGTVSEEVGDE